MGGLTMHREQQRRMTSLRELQLLDSPVEERFDRIIRILCRLFSVPIGFLGLVGDQRVWYKSMAGLPTRELPIEESFCIHALSQEDILSVSDVRKDSRFFTLPWVQGAPHVRFYAACPLLGPGGVKIGTLGIMDAQPRRMSREELDMLRDLGTWATREVNFPVLQKASSRHMDSEVRMRAVLNNVQEGILTLRIDGRIESCNPAAQNIFGFETNEIVGKSILELLDVSSTSKKQEAHQAGLISTPSLAAMIGGELTGIRKDGSTFSMELSLSEMYVGQKRMFTAIVRDITERKTAEIQLQESEERYRDLFENANDLIHITSIDGRFLYVNRAWREALGYIDEEVATLRVPQIILPSQRGPFAEALARVLTGDNVDLVESTFVASNGSLIHVEGSITGKEEGGKIVSVRSIFHDVTERRKVEQMKKEFISVVSHELRTPLTSICGSLGLLSGGVVGELSTKATSMIDIAYNNSQRLVRLINDILDIEKIESGKMSFSMQPVPLMSIIHQALEENAGYAEQHGIQYQVTQSADVSVYADSDRLMQVMNNLLSNAAKFSPKGADVNVAVTIVGERVRVSVIDCGPGIPQDFRERVFAKFAQADSSTTRRKGGTGLGLSICKHLIEGMKGRIDFHSQINVGTTFFFELPIIPSHN